MLTSLAKSSMLRKIHVLPLGLPAQQRVPGAYWEQGGGNGFSFPLKLHLCGRPSNNVVCWEVDEESARFPASAGLSPRLLPPRPSAAPWPCA